jgi:hypothetical protein
MSDWTGAVASVSAAVTAAITTVAAFFVFKQSKEISRQTNQLQQQARAAHLALQTQVARELERDFYRDTHHARLAQVGSDRIDE